MFAHGKRQGGATRDDGSSPATGKRPGAPRSILPTRKRAAARAGFQAVATLADDNDDIEGEASELEDGKAPPAARAAPTPKARPAPGRPTLTMDP